MKKTVLSIGIIFRNNIRSIERCLEALRPLREAVNCELIMADTGSDDGSREVAERYADILFDFPWINDFAAARNAVMDRASGKWFFTVDSDEYLDPDISELQYALRNRQSKADIMLVIQRNYSTYEMDDNYRDFSAGRILRMSTGIRYSGAIHERWEAKPGHQLNALPLKTTVLHHDGYVGMHSEQGKEKRKRNMDLLLEKFKEDPRSLLTLIQMIESAFREPEAVDYIRKAVDLIEERARGWQKVGPPILRYAVSAALIRNLPEYDTWVKLARELFPRSLYTRLDVENMVSINCWNKKDYAGCIEAGERSLAALEEYRSGKFDFTEQMYSMLQQTTSHQVTAMMVPMAAACAKEMKMERAIQLLSDMDYSIFSAAQVAQATRAMMDIHGKSDLDTEALITEFWNAIADEKLPQKQKDNNKNLFQKTLNTAFTRKARECEAESEEFRRYACTLVLPLESELEIGRAAAVIAANDPQLMSEKLASVEDWNQFPIHALGYAMEHGAVFPPAGKTMNVEEMDMLARRLLRADEPMIPWLIGTDAIVVDSVQSLCWARSLALAAVQTFKWSDDGADAEIGIDLARMFAQVEQEVLPLCYTPEVLGEDNLFLLPPLHRFGWYCVQAFEALDSGDAIGYVRFLRAGLGVCKNVKDMVEFLVAHTEQLQMPEPSSELLALAEQIKEVLLKFAPDDPAVIALKQSEAYRKVAYIIEGAKVPVVGNFPQ